MVYAFLQQGRGSKAKDLVDDRADAGRAEAKQAERFMASR